MKRAKRITHYVIANGLFVTAGYHGFFRGIKWCENVWIFYFWFAVVVAFCYLQKEARNRKFKEGPAVPLLIDQILDTVIVIALAALAHFWLAGFWALQAGCYTLIYSEEVKP